MKRPGAGGASAWGMAIALALAGLVMWNGLRGMTAAQREAFAKLDAGAASASASAPKTFAGIPESIVLDAGKSLRRMDVTMRVDGLDVFVDGAAACRDGERSRIGRDPSGGVGSFDEGALATCVGTVVLQRPSARLVAIVTRAGAGVPVTYRDALAAGLRRAGVGDVVLATE